MKVAFDVKGTLIGGGDKVHQLFKWFESKGCEMVIWSSVYSYALDAKNKFGYLAEYTTKRDRVSGEDFHNDNRDYNVDIAVDDDNFIEWGGKIIPTIACNHMILVCEIPSDPSKFWDAYGHLLINRGLK